MVCSSTASAQVSQARQIDSLKRLIANHPPDTVKVSLYIAVSRCYQYFDSVKADAYAERALRLAVSVHNESGVGKYYLTKSERYYLNDDYYGSIRHAIIAESHFRKAKNIQLQMAALYNVTASYIFLEDYGKAEGNIRKTLQLLPASGYEKPKAFLYEACGSIRMKQKRYGEAIAFYNKALAYYRKLSFTLGEASVYIQISLIYGMMENVTAALDYQKKALAIMDSDKDTPPKMIYISQQNIAKLLLSQKKYKEALHFVRLALAGERKLGNDKNILECYTVLAEIDYARGRYAKSVSDCKAALRETPIARQQAQLFKTMAKSFLALNQFQKARKSGYQALGLIRNESDMSKSELSELYLVITETEERCGHYRKAYHLQKIQAKLDKERLESDRQNKIDELMVRFEVKEKDLKLQNMRYRQQAKDLEILRQKLYLFGTVSLLALVFTILSFTYLRLKANKKNSLLIEAKNTDLEYTKGILEKALNEKNLLLREIHHRVKNNLQQVISLLNIHAREHNDLNVNEFLKKGRSRIVAMALLHENLYQTDTIDKVNCKTYIESLLRSISGAYTLDRQVKMKVEVDELYFDIQTSISIGLIVTELVCNSFKYAFEDTAQPMITIRLNALGDGKFELGVTDNGPGFKERDTAAVSFGLDIVAMFVQQLKGEIERNVGRGTSYTITFTDMRTML